VSVPNDLGHRIEAARQRCCDAAIRALQASRQEAAVLQLAEQLHDDLSATLDALPSKALHACAAGCFFCCYLPVDVLAPEAFRIAAHLRHTRAPAELATLACRLASQRQQGLGVHPCVFLADGRCSIYGVRPLVCRAYHSLSRARCEAHHHDPGVDLRGSQDRVAGLLAEAVEDGAVEGLRALGLDADWYELPSAVLRALETPDGARRWASGEAVFRGCDQLSAWQE
jgi:Fe-S-cluster containining protein